MRRKASHRFASAAAWAWRWQSNIVSTGLARVALPDLPTIAEAGLRGYESLSWTGIAAPAGTPKELVARLNREISAVLAQPDMRQKLADAGADAVGGAPELFAEHIRTEREKWSRLIKERGITIN